MSDEKNDGATFRGALWGFVAGALVVGVVTGAADVSALAAAAGASLAVLGAGGLVWCASVMP